MTGIDEGLTVYGDPGFSRFLRRSFLASAGFDSVDLDRPVVGIADTSSDYTTCHRQLPEVIDAIRRGVLEAGGLPLVFPTMSLPEILISPTSMLYRNLLAMETEEAIRGLPMDGIVLAGGCDKTVPAQLMAAASAGIPAISVVAGPMVTGRWRGQPMGACTDCRALWSGLRAGDLEPSDLDEASPELVASAGTCAVMGTASTMACIAEALGMMLPGGATAPAASGARLRTAVASGRTAVALAREGSLRPRRILDEAALRNAATVLVALGGSTNAVIHLLAIARRACARFSLADFETIARVTPLLVDVKPSGSGYLVDLHHAGGLPVVMKALRPLLELGHVGVTGRPLGVLLDEAPDPAPWQTTVRPLDDPLGSSGSLAVLTGSLAPDGALIKAAAASPGLLHHRGPAVVFESPEDATTRSDLVDITADHVLVLRNAGPVASGMPEAGAVPIPRHLAERGISDMVRVSDGRMSGTAFGTVALHCAPEAAVGGPIGLVEDGDLIEIDVASRRLDLLVGSEELGRRRANHRTPELPHRGWRRLYAERVLQADLGADLDFLTLTGDRSDPRQRGGVETNPEIESKGREV